MAAEQRRGSRTQGRHPDRRRTRPAVPRPAGGNAGLPPLTYKREGQTICRIKQYFGDYDLVDLTPAVLRATYTQLRKRGATPSGLHKLHQKLSQVMKQAVFALAELVDAAAAEAEAEDAVTSLACVARERFG